ncbi:phage tail protein [Ralstonia sp. CHL-2022]|uniref:Phage tail protein n=1 Tax=Ralstonia mojiangensis TaxID=2953895 RepID=A0AAE3I3A1_9RALS|nr:phage tail protein [Ralstonia mojiangensis]MCT7316756.1 phage tail protein [Ralstonia mojiangensis]
MMMALDLFVFSLDTAPYSEFQRQVGWRHPSNNRVGRRPSYQFLGPDEETITLSGRLLPELTGGEWTLSALELMADSGDAYTLIEGTGHYYGQFVINCLDTTRSYFFQDGAARACDFTLKLSRVDDGLLSKVASVATGLLQ